MTRTAQTPQSVEGGARWPIALGIALLYLPLMLSVLATSTVVAPESWPASVAKILSSPPRAVPSLPVLRAVPSPAIALTHDPFDPAPAAPAAPLSADATLPHLLATYRKEGTDYALARVPGGLVALGVGDAWRDGRIGVIGSNGIGVDADGHRTFVPIEMPAAPEE